MLDAGSHTRGDSHSHTVLPFSGCTLPPLHATHGALPSLLYEPELHTQSAADDPAGSDSGGQPSTQTPSSHTPLRQSPPCAQPKRTRRTHELLTVPTAPSVHPHWFVTGSQVSEPLHSPHSTVLDQPSEMVPQVAPTSAHVSGVHTGEQETRCGRNGS